MRRVPNAADIGIVIVALALANLHLWNSNLSPQHLLPEKVFDGEWWRVVAHPFVHATPYHLAIDSVAFVFLFAVLGGSRSSRWVAFVVTAAGSALAVVVTSPLVHSIGFGGLSGSAHGLMVVLGVQLLVGATRRQDRVVGVSLVAAIVGKSLYEVITGDVVFGGAHLGSVGTPLVVSHLGGALAGLVFALSRRVGLLARPSINTAQETVVGSPATDQTSPAVTGCCNTSTASSCG